MNKNLFKSLTVKLPFRMVSLFLLCALTGNVGAQNQVGANLVKDSTQYTVPSWTLYKRAVIAQAANGGANANAEKALQILVPKSMPYAVNMNINGDPTSRMAFTWFTNEGVTGGKVKIIKGSASDTTSFAKTLFTLPATVEPVKNLNYCVAANNLTTLAGFAINSKRSYTSNKALVTGLQPNTSYSFIVGKPGAWSKVGTFTTAKTSKDAFSFIYFTDPQASKDQDFNVSQKTTHTAVNMYPNTNFILSCGDYVNATGKDNSEWEYEQFFATQQDIWYKNPLAPVIGNHDYSENKNASYHYNTNNPSFDKKMSTVPGSVYSFVYGDALFMATSFEDFKTPGYLDSLAMWMRKEMAAHKDVKWKIAFYHKTMYTGGKTHQMGQDSRQVRDVMGPVFDELKIDLALQGHDHIYEVIGPMKNKVVVANAVSNQQTVPVTVRENVTGKLGGTFDVTNGTLYFLNNSAGKKKYDPNDLATMQKGEEEVGLKDFFSFFTGRFGQTGEPTFSNITVSTDAINVSTFTVNDAGKATLFDAFTVVKK